MIVEVPSSYPGGSSGSNSEGRMTRDRSGDCPRSGADGTTTQSPLFGIRHACASTQRKADYQDNDQ
jgi:hypothetical protein